MPDPKPTAQHRDEAHALCDDECWRWRDLLASGAITGKVEDREHGPTCRAVARALSRRDAAHTQAVARARAEGLREAERIARDFEAHALAMGADARGKGLRNVALGDDGAALACNIIAARIGEALGAVPQAATPLPIPPDRVRILALTVRAAETIEDAEEAIRAELPTDAPQEKP